MIFLFEVKTHDVINLYERYYNNIIQSDGIVEESLASVVWAIIGMSCGGT